MALRKVYRRRRRRPDNTGGKESACTGGRGNTEEGKMSCGIHAVLGARY
jgi:hypothetical protein